MRWSKLRKAHDWRLAPGRLKLARMLFHTPDETRGLGSDDAGWYWIRGGSRTCERGRKGG